LDIRYSEKSTFDWGPFKDCLNPGRILTDTYHSSPEAVYDDGLGYGSVIYDFHQFDLKEDDIGKYVEIGARVQDDELDFDYIKIEMSYSDGILSYNTEELLNTSSIRNGHEANSVQYEYRNNIGDHTNLGDDDGHLSSSVGIYPKFFNKGKDYHVVYFRWYLNEDILPNLTEDIRIDVDMYDWDNNYTNVSNIQLATCIDCNPPTGTPDPPTLVSVAYSHLNSNIRLEWDEAEGSAEAKFFRIYNAWLRKI
jgi:hypothetical protein